MGRNRRVVLAVLGAAGLGLLSGCGAAITGVMGITVAEDGKPLAVMLVCEGRIESVTLHDADRGPSRKSRLAAWNRGRPATGFSVWSLESGGRGWSVGKPMPPLEPGRTHTLYGWTDDPASATSGVDFTAGQLADLRPGQVRWFKGEEMPGADREGFATGSVEEFRSEGCADL
ncbi:hypothetical protein OH779_14000 [Actinacidiphila glaucinigra]|uniref:hypothetical protein n=1 Tax=Actinacidiphila glaucinigra TaxID=235986 RepID=UPI003868184B